MSNVYSVEVLICATAYIRADSPEEAAELANESFGEDTDASTSRRASFGEIDVSESQLDSDDLPDVSLSPAMTFIGHRDRPKGEFTADDVWEADEA